jgi:hypothetical protein
MVASSSLLSTTFVDGHDSARFLHKKNNAQYYRTSDSIPFSNNPKEPLGRKATILTSGVDPVKANQQLKTLLGSSSARIKPTTILPQEPASTDSANGVRLEQAKSHARVEVDLTLENSICVQGSSLRGIVHVNVRKLSKKESPVMLSDGRIRVVGFERVANQDCHHTFYLHTVALSSICSSARDLYDSLPAFKDGYGRAMQG